MYRILETCTKLHRFHILYISRGCTHLKSTFIIGRTSKIYLSRDMRFPTMWCVRPAKPQTSLRIRAVWSEPLLVAWLFCLCSLFLTVPWDGLWSVIVAFLVIFFSLLRATNQAPSSHIPVGLNFEACIGGYQYPISLEVNRKVTHIPLSFVWFDSLRPIINISVI